MSVFKKITRQVTRAVFARMLDDVFDWGGATAEAREAQPVPLRPKSLPAPSPLANFTGAILPGSR